VQYEAPITHAEAFVDIISEDFYGGLRHDYSTFPSKNYNLKPGNE
jgi:hypothetical protein